MILADRYRLDEKIGHGGNSLIFRATELGSGQAVAVKMFGQNSVDAAGPDRFRREARLGRKLTHPNTVRLLDFGLDGVPMPFIVYELLDGENLAQILNRDGALTEERVGRYADQILQSLEESHRIGVVHRDIKPGNIFICTFDGQRDFVKVLDFGIAKSSGTDAMDLTASGMLVGTPRYMSPEQIEGKQPAPCMDLYAVGMMMAEMLNGVPLLRGSPAQACLQQLSPDPVEFPEALTRSRLFEVMRHAVEKDPTRRTQTATDMLAELRNAMQAPEADGAETGGRVVTEGKPELRLDDDEAPTTYMANPAPGLASTMIDQGPPPGRSEPQAASPQPQPPHPQPPHPQPPQPQAASPQPQPPHPQPPHPQAASPQPQPQPQPQLAASPQPQPQLQAPAVAERAPAPWYPQSAVTSAAPPRSNALLITIAVLTSVIALALVVVVIAWMARG